MLISVPIEPPSPRANGLLGCGCGNGALARVQMAGDFERGQCTPRIPLTSIGQNVAGFGAECRAWWQIAMFDRPIKERGDGFGIEAVELEYSRPADEGVVDRVPGVLGRGAYQ